MRCSSPVLCILALTLLVGTPRASAELVLLDRFDDDALGTPPNGPEIGTYGERIGDLTVEISPVEPGEQTLRTTDDDEESAFVHTWVPTRATPAATIRFTTVLGDGGTYVGGNALTHQALLNPFGRSLQLWWSVDRQLRVYIVTGGAPITLTPGASWSVDTRHRVVLALDSASDTFSLWLDGTPLYTDEPLGTDVTDLYALATASNFASTFVQHVDDVRIDDGFALFGDDFEGANLDAWSVVAPPP